jgi:hypothetical protein
MRVSSLFFCFATVAGAVAAPPSAAQNQPDERGALERAINAPEWVTLSGSIRPRYESMANQFVAGRAGDDEFFGVQTLLRAEFDTGDIIIGGELLDSRRISGNAGGGTPGEIDVLEPAQMYVAWRPADFLAPGAALDLTLGRFTMDIGSRRLVARSNFRSILTTFDGVRGAWTSTEGVEVTAFYTRSVDRAPSDASSALDNEAVFNPSEENVRFAGVHVEGPLPLGITGEVFLFDLDEDDASDAPTRNRDLSTAGLRLNRAPGSGRIDGELEFIRQTGTVRGSSNPADTVDLDHDASFFHVQAGYTFDGSWSPRISVHYDFASGDKSPTDLSSERFDSLFGDRSFEFGPTSIYGAVARTNFKSPAVRLEIEPGGRSEAYAMVRQVKLDQARDRFANSGVRDATGASGSDVGLQVDARYRRWLVPDSVRLAVGGAALFRDDFLKSAPNATLEGDTYYGYTELTFSF